jgi:hypothetical protein
VDPPPEPHGLSPSHALSTGVLSAVQAIFGLFFTLTNAYTGLRDTPWLVNTAHEGASTDARVPHAPGAAALGDHAVGRAAAESHITHKGRYRATPRASAFG